MKEILELKFKILKWIREFFYTNNFIEVDTPLLSASPGIEPYLEPFRTLFLSSSNKRKYLYLPYSPEFHMKKLLSINFDNIFQISHSFRNNEFSKLHLPEFLMLEWYRKNANYLTLIEDVENLISFLYDKLKKSEKIIDSQINLSLPFKRIPVNKLFQDFLNINLEECSNPQSFYLKLKQQNIIIDESYSDDWNTLFFYSFLNVIEPRLKKSEPLFLIDYPIAVSALAKEKEDNKFYAERFELYIKDIEIANGCTELTDYKEHIRRFKISNSERKKLKKRIYPPDKEFLKAIKHGMPPSAGVALGIERLIMVLLNKDDLLSLSPLLDVNL